MQQGLGYLEQLPLEVREVIRSQLVVQCATVTAAGVPIDTPTAVFTSVDLSTLDFTTGLAYPAKAERARKNPKVGLLFDSEADTPVVSVAGMAAVRDRQLQANLERYLAETALVSGKTAMSDWLISRQAVWYYARVFVCINPVHIRWWPNRAAMDELPHFWKSPTHSFQPASDPAPADPASAQPAWPQPPWQELAGAALERHVPCHLTLLDAEGYPIPIGVREARACENGFRLSVPAGAPWREGKATLSFQGREIFVGTAVAERAELHLRVARALPVFPLTADVSQVLQPRSEVRDALMQRLQLEAARRGQRIPSMPLEAPQPTAAALYRAQRRRL